jgi:hypothetical protein
MGTRLEKMLKSCQDNSVMTWDTRQNIWYPKNGNINYFRKMAILTPYKYVIKRKFNTQPLSHVTPRTPLSTNSSELRKAFLSDKLAYIQKRYPDSTMRENKFLIFHGQFYLFDLSTPIRHINHVIDQDAIAENYRRVFYLRGIKQPNRQDHMKAAVSFDYQCVLTFWDTFIAGLKIKIINGTKMWKRYRLYGYSQ